MLQYALGLYDNWKGLLKAGADCELRLPLTYTDITGAALLTAVIQRAGRAW